jgi:hypothetical protein
MCRRYRQPRHHRNGWLTKAEADAQERCANWASAVSAEQTTLRTTRYRPQWLISRAEPTPHAQHADRKTDHRADRMAKGGMAGHARRPDV